MRPTPPAPRLARPRLDRRLDDASERARLVVVHGPIGAGATIALERWADLGPVTPRPFVALDRATDARRVARRLLRTVGLTPEDHPVPPSGGASLGDDALETIARHLAPDTRLILDGVDAVPGAVLDDLLLLLDERHDLTIVAAGHDLSVLTGRWGRPDLVEAIGPDDLRFDRDELRALHAAAGSRPSLPVLDAHLAASEGWATGVALLLLACGDGLPPGLGDDGLPSTVAAVREHVEHRIFGRLDPAEAAVLQATADLDPIDRAMLDAVVGPFEAVEGGPPIAGAAALARLVRAGVPMRPVDEVGERWSVHPMVRATARHLAHRDPASRQRWLHRAAEATSAGGDPVAALGHLARAGDDEELVRFAVVHLPDLVALGGGPWICGVLDAVDDAVVDRVPLGGMTVALAHRFAGDERGAEVRWARALAPASPGQAALSDAAMRATGLPFGRTPEEVLSAVATALRMGDAAETIDDGRPWHLDPAVLVVVLHAAAAEALLRRGDRGDLAAAEARLASGYALARDDRSRAVLLGVEAAIAVERGEVARAERVAAAAAAVLGPLGPYTATVDPRLVLAECRWALGDLASADAIAAEVEAAAAETGAARRWNHAVAIRVAAALGSGALRSGLRRLRDLRSLGLPTAPDEARRQVALEVAILVALGRAGEARAALRGSGLAPVDAPEPHLAIAVAARDEAATQRIVEAWPNSDAPSDRARFTAATIHLRALAGDADGVRRRTLRLATLVLETGYLQPVVDLADGLADLVAEVVAADPDGPVEVVELLHRLRPVVPTRRSEVRLSERELDVLDGIAALRGDAELAAELGVSANTLKTFQRRLYRKLGVGSRGDAVRRAEDLGVLALRPRAPRVTPDG
jgi:LuxR family maltose regulon positive regulatory protein